MRSTSCARAEDHAARAGAALVGCDVEDALAAGRRRAAGLLDDHRHRVGLVQQPQAAGLRSGPCVSRGYMKTPPRIRMRCTSATSEAIQRMLKSSPRGAALAGQALVDVALDRRLPEALVGGVDRELAACPRGSRMSGMREHEVAELAVEREAVRAVADREHEHRRRAVDRVAGGDLLRARLQEVARPAVASAVSVRAAPRRWCPPRR